MKLDTIRLAYPWAEEQKGPFKFATAAVAPDVTAVLLFRTVNLQANCPPTCSSVVGRHMQQSTSAFPL